MRKPAKKTYVKKNKNKKSRVRRRTVKGGASELINGNSNLLSDKTSSSAAIPNLTLTINEDHIENFFFLKPGVIKEGENYTKIKISEGVKEIYNNMFHEKNGDIFTVLDNVNEIIFPKSLEKIGSNCFKGFEKLKTLQFSQDSSVELIIDLGAFSDCAALEEVTLPSNINIISQGVFSNCKSLNKINIPEGVTEIGDDAFNYCTSLKIITFPAKLEKIGERAFQNCHLLVTINNLQRVKNIGKRAFSNCTTLDTVVLPEIKEDNLGHAVFDNCKGLKKVTLPYELVNELYTKFKFIFDSCNNIETVTFSGGDVEVGTLVVSFRQKTIIHSDLFKNNQTENVTNRTITFENVSREALTYPILRMFNAEENKQRTNHQINKKK
tara:strand:+ start:214 stop:1356 length:1143 start_codon:yes stop_codon:yes gene_type:complete